MTEEELSILIAKMIDSPLSLSDSEIDIIAHDPELSAIYETSATICDAYAGQAQMDMTKEWDHFRPKLTKRPIISSRILKAAAILAGILLTSFLIINFVRLLPNRNQKPEMAYVDPHVSATHEISASTSATVAASGHNNAYTSGHTTDLTASGQPMPLSGLEQEPRVRGLSPQATDNSSWYIHPALARYLYWANLKVKKTDEEYMSAYISTLDSLDIAITPPEGVESIPYMGVIFFSPNYKYMKEKHNGESAHTHFGPAFESTSKDAMIVYPIAIDYPEFSVDDMIAKELIAAYRNDSIDVASKLSVIDDHGLTNADQVLMYEYDVVEPQPFCTHQGSFTFNEGKPHCVALALKKDNHYGFPIKIFLNDEGLKHKDEYIDIALRSIRLGDNIEPSPYATPEERAFHQYRDEMSDLDTEIALPDDFNIIALGFKDSYITVNQKNAYKYPRRKAGWWYSVALESAEKDGAILLPLAAPLSSFGDHIEDEIVASTDDPKIDATDLVKIITGQEANRITNSDTIAIYHVEFASPFMGRYPHCMGVYLKKKDHPSWLVKIVTPDDGQANTEILLDKLLHSIRYGDTTVKSQYPLAHDDLKFPKGKPVHEDTDILIRGPHGKR